MSNSITQISKYIPYLDEVYANASLTAPLDTAAGLVRETVDAKTVLIGNIAMNGLGNYNRANGGGFVDGDVTLSWESHTFSYDRGRSFQIDNVDNMETLGLAFGTLASQFIRTKVAPEVDAIRFSKYASGAGLGTTGTLSASTAVSAILDAEVAMKEAEVDLANAVIFMTPTVAGYIKEDTTHYSRPLAPNADPNHNFATFDGMRVVEVPQTRFYKGITLYDGTTSGQTAGGYIKTASTGKDINFMIVDPAAVVQIAKHAKLRVFDPDTNQDADAYKVDYRIYHDGWVLANKTAGIYAHTKA